ncbi:hypothetical protein NXS19_010105 [Fusarium pseudograminearum]|uniref:Myb-like domain-containing protein n=1 Tax=Fusarium pseudograminearum (strain CS3096) TaxID=1028729 RepID=K3VTR3_FUSPC|nr:hypothetical protein FPSE_00967 [Fusarium pseudograminearum CS3096]EKJ78824.1 hypothetical protein FPSE_00967 [Fusarium pseudograminearum CS3096]KAF0640696.1 hypothetical protein FPSE5266_00967 [Fusarium pseudograminearum]UZP42289.1 hypothetical protein NXS19_010105 [Fusarium pseudograminearum]
MPPAEKKWDANAERDLCVAIIMGAQDGERMRYNWPKVHSSMESLGYSFTKDAISQHFSKSIMRDFKGRHGEVSAGNSPAPASTPTPKKTPRKRATPAKGRKKKVESEDEDEDAVDSPLAKKMKHKKEEIDDDVKMSKTEDDRGATPEKEARFGQWLAGSAGAPE